MRKILLNSLLGIAAMCFTSTAFATTININFDSLPSGPIAPGAFADVVFTNATVASTGFEASAPNSIFSTSSGVSFGQANAVGVIFNTPATHASIVGLNVGFNGLRLDAFDAANNLLATTTIFGTTEGGTAGVNPPGETFTLSITVANIARLAIYQPITTFNDTIVLDNFSADVGGAAVPEPATLTLVALGMAGAAIRRRRRS